MGVNYSGSYAVPRIDLGSAFMEYMFEESKFIGLRVLVPFRTPKKKGTFPKIKKESLLLPGQVKRAPKAAYNRTDFEAKDQGYECVERGQESQLDHGQRDFYRSDFDAEMIAARVAWWKVLYDQENDIKDILYNTTTFTTGNGLRTDVSTAWSDASADIIGDVEAAKEKVRARIGMDPDTLVIGAAVIPYMIKNTAIRGSIQPTRLPGRNAILEALTALFGLDRILVGKGVYNTAAEGQAYSGADIWGAGWASVVKTAAGAEDDLETPCIGRTMVWDDQSSADGVMVEEYEEPQTNSTIFRSRNFCDELLIDASFGQLLDIAG